MSPRHDSIHDCIISNNAIYIFFVLIQLLHRIGLFNSYFCYMQYAFSVVSVNSMFNS